MDIDFKQLKKLASTCRKLGIKQFKSQSFEFTLNDIVTTTIRTRKPKTQNISNPNASIVQTIQELDQLTEDQLLFYSSSSPLEGVTNEN